MFVFFFTFVIVFVFILILVWTNTERHRIYRTDVYRLVEKVLDHKSVLQEWELFLVCPIDGDADLEVFRKQCRDLDLRASTGMEKFLLNPDGEKELEQLLIGLRNQGKRDF